MSDGVTRGDVRCEEAYAQGKMLDHSDWSGVLPRSITPSDVDFMFDNRGRILLCELSSSFELWSDIPKGQRLAYEAFVSTGQATAVLLKHSVPVDRKINTFTDIDRFSVMLTDSTRIWTTRSYPGKDWERFVRGWFVNASDLHAKVLFDVIEKWKDDRPINDNQD